MALLDPKLDIVFKLLLMRDEALLRSMLAAILRPPSPIQEITILNPEVERDLAMDKGAVLDLRVALHDGTVVDLEMQLDNRPSVRKRVLYYWRASTQVSSFVGMLTCTFIRSSSSCGWSARC